MEYPKRKHPRLKNYDYSQNGCYFVTVCVKDKKHLLGQIKVGRDAHIPPTTDLSENCLQLSDLLKPWLQKKSDILYGKTLIMKKLLIAKTDIWKHGNTLTKTL